jgi:hypothetical protein
MNVQKEIERKCKLKEEQLRDLEQQITQVKAQLETYREVLKVIGKSSDSSASDALRPGSLVDMARNAIREFGKPMHVDKLLIAIGKEPSKKNKVSLSGSMAHYVRQGIIFTRPAPNTFGLRDFDESETVEIPEEFGKN